MQRRELTAFLAAPAAVPLLLALTVYLIGGSGWGFVFVMATYVCYAHALVLGLPLYLWLRRRQCVGIRLVVIGSFCIGALPMALFSMFTALDELRWRALDISEFISLLRDDALTWPGIIQPIIGAIALGGLGAITGVVWLVLAGGFGRMRQSAS